MGVITLPSCRPSLVLIHGQRTAPYCTDGIALPRAACSSKRGVQFKAVVRRLLALSFAALWDACRSCGHSLPQRRNHPTRKISPNHSPSHKQGPSPLRKTHALTLTVLFCTCTTYQITLPYTCGPCCTHHAVLHLAPVAAVEPVHAAEALARRPAGHQPHLAGPRQRSRHLTRHGCDCRRRLWVGVA